MSEHDHDQRADEAERELAELQERSDKLGEEIEGTGEAWERRKADDSVPGATGAPSEEAGDDGGTDGGELDFGRALGDDADDA
jgi:hypothetical protein